ncbi:MAG: alpha/beta fold hydrolase [bacterium]
MSAVVELNGVRTWYEQHGQGEPLVALHPGLADSRAFGPNIGAWSERFRVFTPERRGHGHTPDVDGPLTFDLMARDTVAFLETVVAEPARVLGCSDGAIVALLTAFLRPDLVSQLVFVSGVFHFEGWYPQAIDPNNQPPDFMRAGYGQVSPDGVDHFPVVVAKMAEMHLHEPAMATSDLKKIPCRTLVMVGDDDEVRLEHALDLYRGLPRAELAIVPGTSHGLLVEKAGLCNAIILDFLENNPVATLAPVRRAPG